MDICRELEDLNFPRVAAALRSIGIGDQEKKEKTSTKLVSMNTELHDLYREQTGENWCGSIVNPTEEVACTREYFLWVEELAQKSKYARHLDDCPGYDRFYDKKCTCGFSPKEDPGSAIEAVVEAISTDEQKAIPTG